MKQFNLEEYLKNPNREVVTRDGHKVRIICTDRKNHDSYPIIALVESDEDDEKVRSFKIDGKWSVNGFGSDFDLFFAPVKHEGWINVYKWGDDYRYTGDVFSSKEKALKCIQGCDNVATIKIEWEE